MKSMLPLSRGVAAIMSLGWAVQTASAQYFMGKHQTFIQTSATGAVASPSGGFAFGSSAPSAVTLTLPAGTVAPDAYVQMSDEFELGAVFGTKAALDAAYPNGTYRMTGPGIPTLSFNLATDAYTASTPAVVGGTWNAGVLVVNPAQANTINFSTFSDYGTLGVASHQAFNLSGMNSNSNVDIEQQIATQPIFGLTASATPFTSYTIPAGRLVSGQVYEAELEFDVISVLDTTTIPDGGLIGLFSKKLTFYIAAQAPGTSTPTPVITTQPTNQTGPLGSSVTFSVGATFGTSTQVDFNTTSMRWSLNGKELPFLPTKYVFNPTPSGLQTMTINNLTAADVGTYTVTIVNAGGVVTSAGATYAVGPAMPPSFTRHPTSASVGTGGSAQLSVTANNAATYQWQRNGTIIPGAVGPNLVLSGPGLVAGAYTAVATGIGGSTTSSAAIIAIAATAKVDGAASEIASDIAHPLGNIYDQVLMTGATASIRADTGQVTRVSFLDLNDDIVQVEFAGAGRLAITLDGATGPAAPVKYNQTVNYMKGHASIVISGANETTNVSVFSVGRGNAVNQALFKDNVTYDAHADIAYLAILSTNGRFGGARTANASYFSTKGITGIQAAGITFDGPVFVSDINAFDDANPVLIIGGSPDVRVTGGDLLQTNGRAVAVAGITQLKFTAGSNSQGTLEPAQTNKARLEQNGVDVTAQIVVNP